MSEYAAQARQLTSGRKNLKPYTVKYILTRRWKASKDSVLRGKKEYYFDNGIYKYTGIIGKVLEILDKAAIDIGADKPLRLKAGKDVLQEDVRVIVDENVLREAHNRVSPAVSRPKRQDALLARLEGYYRAGLPYSSCS